MASGDTLCMFDALCGGPPSTNYATVDHVDGSYCLDFDTTTQEAVIFTAVMPQNYAGGDLSVYLHWAATSATSGTIGWTLELERKADGDSMASGSWASATTVTAATVPGSAQAKASSSATISGAALDGITAGDLFRLRVKRDVANDTATGDAELYSVEIREA